MKLSAREILRVSDVKNKLKLCFKKCALGRRQLRMCVVNSMKAGLTKEDVLTICYELGKQFDQQGVALCSLTTIGQAQGFEEKYGKVKSSQLSVKEKEEMKCKLKECFEKCDFASRQLRQYVIDTLDTGLSIDEILAITDDIVGGLGKNQVSACAIVALDQVLRFEKNFRKKPIDIVKERTLEEGDF